MTRYKKIGIILILIGLCIPIIAFVFASGYNPKLGFWWSISHMNILLQEGSIKGNPGGSLGGGKVYDTSQIKFDVYLPYKYPFSLGIILVFSGFAIFFLAKSKKDEK